MPCSWLNWMRRARSRQLARHSSPAGAAGAAGAGWAGPGRHARPLPPGQARPWGTPATHQRRAGWRVCPGRAVCSGCMCVLRAVRSPMYGRPLASRVRLMQFLRSGGRGRGREGGWERPRAAGSGSTGWRADNERLSSQRPCSQPATSFSRTCSHAPPPPPWCECPACPCSMTGNRTSHATQRTATESGNSARLQRKGGWAGAR